VQLTAGCKDCAASSRLKSDPRAAPGAVVDEQAAFDGEAAAILPNGAAHRLTPGGEITEWHGWIIEAASPIAELLVTVQFERVTMPPSLCNAPPNIEAPDISAPLAKPLASVTFFKVKRTPFATVNNRVTPCPSMAMLLAPASIVVSSTTATDVDIGITP
jgi:hypothetical protein